MSTHIGGGGSDVATNSGMVRIGDVLNSEDINIYHALRRWCSRCSGVARIHNPIGGQSALIKLRWGESPRT